MTSLNFQSLPSFQSLQKKLDIAGPRLEEVANNFSNFVSKWYNFEIWGGIISLVLGITVAVFAGIVDSERKKYKNKTNGRVVESVCTTDSGKSTFDCVVSFKNHVTGKINTIETVSLNNYIPGNDIYFAYDPSNSNDIVSTDTLENLDIQCYALVSVSIALFVITCVFWWLYTRTVDLDKLKVEVIDALTNKLQSFK